MDRKLSRAERTEVERHRRQMSQEQSVEVDTNTATADWLERHSEKWRRARHVEMLGMQCDEIRRHVWLESEQAGRDIAQEAKLDWISKHAANWRDWYTREFEMYQET